ncbi:hypothetical protein AgCh_011175 [Apium graveolens]
MQRVFNKRDVLWGILSNRLRALPQSSKTRTYCNSIKPNNNNKNDGQPKINNDGSMSHYEAYKQLDNLDFMTAAKIAFSAPKKKFGCDVQLERMQTWVMELTWTTKNQGAMHEVGQVKDSDEVYDPGIDGYFTGLGSIDDFVEWVTQVDKISAYTGWTEMRIFKIAALKLTKKAGLWFDNLNTKRVRSGKEKIMTWTSLKKKFRAKYIPLHYKFECIMKMTSLSQGTMSVSEYTSEFYRLRLICDLEETETIKIGRFIRGLNLPIYRKVKSNPYISFNDICNLALEFESFQQDEKLKSSLHEFTLSEETKEEDFVSVENVADLVADYHLLHVATTSSMDEKDEPVTKEAMIEKHEERQSLVEKVLFVEKDQIDASPKFMRDVIVDGQEILKEKFETKEVVDKENNIIQVEHIDFLGVENLLNAPISSN